MGRPARVTREQVLSAARQAFVEKGFHGTTLTDIAARLGVSAAALLRHAPSKEALFGAAMEPEPSFQNLPMDFLASVDPSGDPRPILRRLALAFVPFIEAKMAENIARWMHAKTPEEARTFRLPFDPLARPTPPQRGLALVEDYLRRAVRAKRLRVRDPRAAALVFIGSLHSYVFLHRVMRILEPPMPLEHYVDTLMDVWENGALPRPRRSPGKSSSRRGS